VGDIRWSKFQDFYLRLGFLKVLVAVLNPQRPSVNNESVYRRIARPLLESARLHQYVKDTAEKRIHWYDRAHAEGRKLDQPSVAEALLVQAESPSLLFAITGPTAYKVLDWGHDIGLVGRGNQLTERGVILRTLLPEESCQAFFDGDLAACNPFILSSEERLFFLFHLLELDGVIEVLIDRLAADTDGLVDTGRAAQMTCHALFQVLDAARADLQPRDVPAYRNAKELACTIAAELSLTQYEADCGEPSVRRLPKPIKVPKPGSIKRIGHSSMRRTTKNADHQTIPRFEQLVDLGFVTKPLRPRLSADAAFEARRHWNYWPTDEAQRWVSARAVHLPQSKDNFCWDAFAKVASSTFGGHMQDRPSQVRIEAVSRFLWNAYLKIRRPMGHTPFDSVALLAMINAVCAGMPIEMRHFHKLMLAIKQLNVLPEHAFFASGNDLDRMFVLLKNGTLDALLGRVGLLSGWENR